MHYKKDYLRKEPILIAIIVLCTELPNMVVYALTSWL